MANLIGNSGMFTQSEFQSRGVIKLAPDILVYIGGNLKTMVLAPVQNTNPDIAFNDGITTVNVQNSIENPGNSTASIEVITPIYGPGSQYWVELPGLAKKTTMMPVFVPMMEVKIYMRGRFMVNMQPKYYPIFWGFITTVEENYSGGVYKINIQCGDMLHWWQYVQINIHPVPGSNYAVGGGQTITAYHSIFKAQNPFTILWRLTMDAFGDANQMISPTWVAQRTPLSQIFPPAQLKNYYTQIIEYWRGRFKNIGSLLKMYGADGELIEIEGPSGKIRTLKPRKRYDLSKNASSDKKRASNSYDEVIAYDVSNSLKNFTVFFEFDNMSDFADAEYMSKLEIATEMKNRIEYEFFQDVDGNFIFKPPFYNLNTKYVEPYVIRPNDIINFSSQVDSEGIVTVVQVKVPFHGQLRSAEYPNNVGFHIDVELAQRYGIRFKEIPLQYISNKCNIARELAVGHCGMINAKCLTGTVTIPARPELRLGYPIYIEHKDCFYYVKSINHSFDYGGSATTTLSLEAQRKKEYIYEGDKFKLQTDKVYTFDSQQTVDPKSLEMTAAGKKEWDYLRSSNILEGTMLGRWKVTDRKYNSQISATAESIPYTDEEGYKVVGSFSYGRGIVVNGSTRMDDITMRMSQDLNISTAQAAANQALTMIAPRSAGQESRRMESFFNLVPSNEEGIVPSFIENKAMNIDVHAGGLDVATIVPSEVSASTASSRLVNQP